MTPKQKAKAVEDALMVKHAMDEDFTTAWCGAKGTLVETWQETTCLACLKEGVSFGSSRAKNRLEQLQRTP